MPTRTRFYIAVVVALTAAVVAIVPWQPLYSLGWRGVAGLASFVGLAVLAEAMAVQFAVVGRRNLQSSIAFLPIIACAASFPIAASTVAVFVALSAAEALRRGPRIWVSIFNVAQGICAVAVGSSLYSLLDGQPDFARLQNVAAFSLLVVGFFGTNLILVAGYLSIDQDRRFFAIVRQAVGSGGGNLFYDILASPVALIAAILYYQLGEIGLLLVIFPLLLIRYSYLSKLQLQQANRDLLKVLIKAIETRDPYTSGHSVRVSTMARIIGEEMRLPLRELERLETAALLHDIGKIDMSYAPIIQKPSELTEQERNTIRTHATHGAELLRTLTSLDEPVILGVRHHHEHFDGSGYPDGLTGTSIPLFGRVIMICDAVDAMLSDRPYRRALSPEQVQAELRRFSGTQFDPDLVAVLMRPNVLQQASSVLRDDSFAEQLLVAAGGR
jgi:putative nucleotidyltransferase with HDIG domain